MKKDRWAQDDALFIREEPAQSEDPSSPPPPPPSQRKRSALLDGCRSVEEFVRLDRIDEGSYGVVYRARDSSSNEVVALKRVKLTRDVCAEGFPITALRETNVLLALNHEHIVKVHEMVVGAEHDKVFMVMDHYECDLKTYVEKHEGPFSQNDVMTIFGQVVDGVEHMHSRWFVHRDIKTSNILYRKGKVALCDFGLARKYGDPIEEEYTNNVVTLWYRAPELLLGARRYSTELDCWSMGCVFAELLQKNPLFQAKTEVEQLAEIFRVLGAPTQDRWPDYHNLPFAKHFTFRSSPKNKLRDKFPAINVFNKTPLTDSGFKLLDSLLALDPRQRMTAAQAIEHPYFKQSYEASFRALESTMT